MANDRDKGAKTATSTLDREQRKILDFPEELIIRQEVETAQVKALIDRVSKITAEDYSPPQVAQRVEAVGMAPASTWRRGFPPKWPNPNFTTQSLLTRPRASMLMGMC